MSPALKTVELLLAAPSPSDGEKFTPVSVSPGLPGFIATFILAALLVLLLTDMARRVRRLQAANRVRERYEGQEARAEQDQDDPEVQGEPHAQDGPEEAEAQDRLGEQDEDQS